MASHERECRPVIGRPEQARMPSYNRVATVRRFIDLGGLTLPGWLIWLRRTWRMLRTLVIDAQATTASGIIGPDYENKERDEQSIVLSKPVNQFPEVRLQVCADHGRHSTLEQSWTDGRWCGTMAA